MMFVSWSSKLNYCYNFACNLAVTALVKRIKFCDLEIKHRSRAENSIKQLTCHPRLVISKHFLLMSGPAIQLYTS